MARSPRLLLLVYLNTLFWLTPCRAQINTTGSTNCTVADFDTEVEFLNGPGDTFALVVRMRNVSPHACVFDGPEYGPSIAPDRVDGEKPFGLCYFCEERSHHPQAAMPPPITVAPGEAALQTFRWKTVAADSSVHCVTPKWISGPVLLVTPSLLKPVCSPVDVSHFTLKTSEVSADATPNAQRAAFELTTERNRYYTGESFSLKLAPVEAGPGIVPNPKSCPTFYLRERSPNGATRIDEVQPITSVGCKSFIPGRRPINSESSFEIESGANSRWMGVGEHTLRILQLAGSADDSRIEFISSNVLHLAIADPVTMARKWGTKVKGIAADVTLEKDTYRTGENVPLHMAVADFDAPVTIFTWDPLWDPCSTVGVQVLDSAGRPLSDSQRFPDHYMCMGHGFGPRPIEKGKVIPIERTLAGEGWLPNQPGTYTIVVRWSPCTGKNAPNGGLAEDLKTYAIAEASATIHILSAESNSKEAAQK